MNRAISYTPLLLALASAMEAFAEAPAKADPGLEFFEKKIRPILSENCYSCHSADTKAAGDLRVDDLNGLLTGGNDGPAIVRGDAEKSILLQRVNHHDPKRRMPKEGDALTESQIADLTTWIQNGAAWPVEEIPSYIGKDKGKYEALRKSHWSWQPLTKPAIPKVSNESWPADEIDRFVLSKLDAEELAPVEDAKPEALLRRITFDLTGLPPSKEELEAFSKNHSNEAYGKVIDRLLASPAFGERWGRHWLDVARYGESTGPSRNIPYPHAWKYRDYVLDAVNRDVPFDRFIQEQIAGDLLPAANSVERDRLLTATGFLALGVKDVNQRFKVRFQMDNVDEQIDTVSRSVLGLTVSCARCHDHKFDPIPTTDYYSMAGIFTSTDDCAGVRNKMGGGGLDYYNPSMLIKLSSDAPPPAAEEVARLQAQLDEAKKAWDAIRGTPEGTKRGPNGQPVQRPFRLKYEQAQADLLALTDPAAQGFAVHGVRDSQSISDTQVRIRGEAERMGPTVPRGFLSAFAVSGVPSVNPTQSGRVELAQWLTSPNNPLASRVAVNRIWQHLFGQGIVSTVDNFGVNGDIPSHPELLDHLANRFIAGNWSVKKMVKEIALSRTYRLGGDAPADHLEKDPANHLLWRHAPRRMSAEEIRDTILAVSGNLQSTPPSEAAVKELKMIEMRDNGKEAASIHDQANKGLYRSIYLPLLRGVIPKSLEAFDPVTQSLVTGQRETTTVPTQALFMLNSPFVREQSLALAEKIATAAEADPAQWISTVYLRAFGRSPDADELARSLQFIGEFQSGYEDSFAVHAELAQMSTPVTETASDVPVNPDDIPREDQTANEKVIAAKDAKSAAWMAFIQAVFASAEFRFIR